MESLSIIELLASSQGTRGSAPNVALAMEIASSGNNTAVAELAELLNHKDRNIQSDSIKTLYEIGYRNPELIAPCFSKFLNLLSSKNNRMVWGSMAALASIAKLRHSEIFESLDTIMDAVNKGSVITIDCGVEILAKLNGFEQYYNTTDSLLLEQLEKCPIKQLPSYGDKALKHIGTHNKEPYRNILARRLDECDKESQRKKLKLLLRAIS